MTPTAAPVIDLDVLKALVGDNPGTIARLLLTFQVSGHETAEALQRAAREQQPDEVTRHAHKLKSSARTLGALRLGDLCESLESAGLAGDRAQIAGLMEEFRGEYQSVRAELERQLREHGATRNCA